jgi:hypothetical protein
VERFVGMDPFNDPLRENLVLEALTSQITE